MDNKFVEPEFRALHQFGTLKEFKEWAEALLNYDQSSPLYDTFNLITLNLSKFPEIYINQYSYNFGLTEFEFLGYLGLDGVVVTHKGFDWKIIRKSEPTPSWEFEIL